jgi:hypothetical protein
MTVEGSMNVLKHYQVIEGLMGRTSKEAGTFFGDAVPKNRHIVGNREDFIHLVGDVDDAHAMRLEVRDDSKEVIYLSLGERGGRLVHDQDV